MHLQGFGGDDSDVGSPRNNHGSAASTNRHADPPLVNKDHIEKKKAKRDPVKDVETSTASAVGESCRSMGEILSSMEPGKSLSVSGLESSSEKTSRGSSLNTKRSAFWGRSTVSSCYSQRHHLL